ncbi:LysR family transcriptional regulator [Frigidibacter sp. SD6-1]|uniref:LysR family transcriptional regulator n=1 Tax=Frigidibacter sp. SD6-1 TaxID=3032581 RepID=UPI0024DF765D|nr:LysR family transcriptional regulator [Frigidibacter sp. SD6-1]
MSQIDWLNFPPLSALRALEAAVRLGGYSAAARALNVTHAAIAQQVRGLEEFLGRPLVHREGRQLVFSDEAQELAAAANRGFAEMQTALMALRARQKPNALSVTTTPIFAERWLMPRLRDFWMRHPDITLTLRAEQDVVDLRREGIDVAIRYGLGHWPGVEAEFLTSARMMAVGAESLLQGRADPSPGDLKDLPWVLEQGWPETEQWLACSGVDLSGSAKSYFLTEELMLAAGRAGLGLFVASSAIVEQDIAEGRLRLLLDDCNDTHSGYFIVTAPGPLTVAKRTFIKWLRAQAQGGPS